MVATTEREKSFTARNGGPTWPEDRFLSQFVQRREMAHPLLTKDSLQLSQETTMLFLPFLLAQNLSPKDIVGSDITS